MLAAAQGRQQLLGKDETSQPKAGVIKGAVY
jgi:hypothetical protein